MKKIVLVGNSKTNQLIDNLKEVKARCEFNWEILQDHEKIVLFDKSIPEIMEKYLIINVDTQSKIDLSSFQGFHVITIGFNKKASITVSSVEEDEIVFCIQREIGTVHQRIEPQEVVCKINHFKLKESHLLFVFSIFLLFGSVK